jgi:menaquinone-dependent protoporphyrinogen oxidase
VLVAYASKRGGTREIAEAIAETMLNEGVDVELADAAEVRDVSGYDAVIIGGALYMSRWHRAARKLVTHNTDALRARPVWLFSSGPLDASATEHELPPTHQVENLIDLVGARGHIVFGGRLARDATGFPAAAMAKKMAGDWREWHQIRGWARQVAGKILDEEPHAVVVAPAPRRVQRWLLAALCLFTGLTAIGGGASLVLRPDGSLLAAPPSLLQHSPFTTFLIPGLLLLVVIGLGHAITGVLVARDTRLAPYFAYVAGAALLVWISVEMILLRSHHWLQIGYLSVAVLILVEARSITQTRQTGTAMRGALASAERAAG